MAKKYIDADSLINYLYDYQDCEIDIPKEIAEFPSADVVEVVRCEKCCFAKPFNDVWFQPKRDTLWCSVFMQEREPEWFCADAERRSDD